MTDKNLQAQPDMHSLVNQLSETIQKIDKDDLSILAQMHEWCEELVDFYSEQDQSESSPVVQHTQSLGQALEQLILGETEDAETLLGEIANSINDLHNLIRNSGIVTDELSENIQQDSQIFAAEQLKTDKTKTNTNSDANNVATNKPIVNQTLEQETSTYESSPLTIDPKEIEFVKAFAEEAQEHIEAIETGLIEVEQAPENTGKIDDLFRPFHTIKGMAGFLNLRDINCLTHEVETLLDQGRKGKRAMTPGIIDLIFNVIDVLKEQVSSVGSYLANPTGDVVYQPPISKLIDHLRKVVSGKVEPGNETAYESGGKTDSEQSVAPPSTSSAVVESTDQSKSDNKTADNSSAEQQSSPTGFNNQQRSSPANSRGQTATDTSIRIETTKLDALVDMVGELVIAQTLVESNDQIKSNAKLNKDAGQVTKIVREVQEVAMSMRMVPIGPTFNKMARLVRDVSRKGGKRVELSINGEDTELDKTVIQQISDPLVHMVRNAVDHGIENANDRRVAGKNEMGQVCLSAYHHGGNIVIEISDDGKGLDPEVLIQKARDKGIIQPGEELTDEQAYALIFAPGFSTAKEVTDISGRGVGMDVVRRNIEQLRGRIDITSEKGNGTTFAIRLPLTLAIIDGMVVRIGSEKFIIPTIAIEQSLQPTPEQVTSVQQKGEVINVRGRLIPLIQLGNLFELSGPIDPCDTMVVIVQSEGQQVGLVVDELHGQQQVVIKSLGERFEKLQGICGAAILGDGRVGLILEMSGLAKLNEINNTGTIRGRKNEEDLAAADVANQLEHTGESEEDDIRQGNVESPTN